MYYLGIDCGTQGTKAIVYDAQSRSFAGEGYAPHEIAVNDRGGREQDVQWWITALECAVTGALQSLDTQERKKIAGIGVSAQQHGLVILDSGKRVLRMAKLWNDTETASSNDRYIEEAGGLSSVISEIGTAIPVGYTVSKLIWIKEHEPELFQKIAYAMNPKDYINFYLTGVIATDAGSASGTGYFDVLNRSWNQKMVSLIAPDFREKLPPVLGDLAIHGRLKPELAEKYGLSPSCIVAPGSGDNMTAAVGTGNVESGVATMNLGTSGVLSVFTGQKPQGYSEIVQIQNSIPDGWIPTICSMNATSTTTTVQECFALDIASFDSEMEKASIGAGGLKLFPFFNGERAPSLPAAKGCLSGLTIHSFTRENCIRAAAEAVAFGMRWGRDLLAEKGVSFRQLRLVGGGSNSAPWRQIFADVFDTEIIGVKGKEAGAFGALIQAMAVCGEGTVQELCRNHIELDTAKSAVPRREPVQRYQELYADFLAERARFFGC